MEKKKISTKTIVIIVICIVLLLTLIGGGVYWYIFVLNADKNSPEEVLTQYVSYINEKILSQCIHFYQIVQKQE